MKARVSLPVVGNRKWTDAPRPRSVPARRLTMIEIIAGLKANAEAEDLPPRPKTRAECGEQRPCPWVSCRFHLYLDVSEQGWLKLNFPGQEVWEMTESCALDVAAKGGVTLEQVGRLLNISLEGARQVEMDVVAELRLKIEGDGDGQK